ncbi:MAG TPA: penicillin-binding protein activator [Pelomicrobium sp.]|nr:penicillin-binding protein activator [Pelomicrobium sp.]
MQRLILCLAVLAAALYGIPSALATDGSSPGPTRLSQASDGFPFQWQGAAHIALVLPLNSPDFRRAAEMVRQGFLVAAGMPAERPLPTRVYATDADSEGTLLAYQDALRNGASVVVGPLTRDGVATLAASGLVQVPTLALNMIDARGALLPSELYFFGLSIEAEAQQLARLAHAPDRTRAYVVSSGSPLANRIRDAFTAAWEALGGTVAGELLPMAVGPELWPELRRQVAGSDAVALLAMEFDRARLIRPYIDPAVPVYATSLVNQGGGAAFGSHDLNGVRFVDMPWLLAPQRPPASLYPRPDTSVGVDLERLYALGIDAYRLALEVVRLPAPGAVAVDGVTGDITLTPRQQFQRDLMPAEFFGGTARPLGDTGR